MHWEQSTDLTVKTWDALANLIRERQSTGQRGTFLYGDLADRLFGARNNGAQSFGSPLGNISDRIQRLNSAEKSAHPYLNALVFDLDGNQAGIPTLQDADEVWSFIEQQDGHYLDRLGEALGFVRGSGTSEHNRREVPAWSDFPRITRNPAVMQGKACIRGMRVTVGMILGNLSGGATIDELLDDFPYLEREDIMQALGYGAWLASEREIRLDAA